jgi:hypothetical protein
MLTSSSSGVPVITNEALMAEYWWDNHNMFLTPEGNSLLYVHRKLTRAGQVLLVQSGTPTWAIRVQRANHSPSPKYI